MWHSATLSSHRIPNSHVPEVGAGLVRQLQLRAQSLSRSSQPKAAYEAGDAEGGWATSSHWHCHGAHSHELAAAAVRHLRRHLQTPSPIQGSLEEEGSKHAQDQGARDAPPQRHLQVGRHGSLWEGAR